MNFQDACSLLISYLSQSNGSNIITANGGSFRFFPGEKYRDIDVANFEEEFGVLIPEDYKFFLKEVGASRIFIDRFGLGIVFYPLNDIAISASHIFLGMKNVFPDILPIAANLGRGDIIGFDTRVGLDSRGLGTFSSEDDPEKWLDENSYRSTFSDWLVTLIESDGEKDTI